MAKLIFKDLSFFGENSKIRIDFLKYFYFSIDKDELRKIDDFDIGTNYINFKNINEKSARNKFNLLLERGFNELKSKLTGKKAVYIHKNSRIPLIGNNSFGIIDRNTNLIEVKPITGCNLSCIYCSVDQEKRNTEFVVEEEYLIAELKKVIEYKECNNIEIHIASQGEPFFYSYLKYLIKDIKKINNVKVISIDTNGTLLSKKIIDEMVKAGLTRFNLSINSLNKKKAEHIAGCNYNPDNIKELCSYILNKCDLLIAPVLILGINDEDIEDIIKFYKNLKGKYNKYIGIQNFLEYRFGRKPVKALPMDEFYKRLKSLEDKYKISLIVTKFDFDIVKTKSLLKPFKKGNIIKANIICDGRFKNEKIAAADNRNISVPNCYKKGMVKLKITRSKHNIFFGKVL